MDTCYYYSRRGRKPFEDLRHEDNEKGECVVRLDGSGVASEKNSRALLGRCLFVHGTVPNEWDSGDSVAHGSGLEACYL